VKQRPVERFSGSTTKAIPIVTIPKDCEAYVSMQRIFSKGNVNLHERTRKLIEGIEGLNLRNDVTTYPLKSEKNSEYLACFGQTVVCLIEIPKNGFSENGSVAMLSFFLGESTESNGTSNLCSACKYSKGENPECCKGVFYKLLKKIG
jgi:hypothetical protein